MTNVSAPSRHKANAAPKAATVTLSAVETAPSAAGPDIRTLAQSLRSVISSAIPGFEGGFNCWVIELLLLANRHLDQVIADPDGGDVYVVEALLAGALNLDKAMRPKEKERRKILEAAFDMVAALSADSAKGPEPAEDVTLGGSKDELVTRDTELPKGGRVALDLVWAAATQVEAVSENVMKIVEEAGLENETESLLRMYALRISRMNSIVMSYHGDDNVTLNQAHEAIYGRWMPKGALE